MPRLPAFSLIETLVAFAVLTTAFALMVPHLPFVVARTDARVEAALAEDFARSRLDSFGRLRRAEASSTSGTEGDRWLWRETAVVAPVGSLENRAFKVTVEVFDASGRTRLAVVDGYRR